MAGGVDIHSHVAGAEVTWAHDSPRRPLQRPRHKKPSPAQAQATQSLHLRYGLVTPDGLHLGVQRLHRPAQS
jgi:formylmethanofuran dehydrogenase subunit A